MRVPTPGATQLDQHASAPSAPELRASEHLPRVQATASLDIARDARETGDLGQPELRELPGGDAGRVQPAQRRRMPMLLVWI